MENINMNIDAILEKIDASYEDMMNGKSLNSARTALIGYVFEIAKLRYEAKHKNEKVEEVKTEEPKIEIKKENKTETKVDADQLLKWAKRQ